MTERERCIFCKREEAASEDWKRASELDDDQPNPEMDMLCWDPLGAGCRVEAKRIGRPTDLTKALEALDAKGDRG